MAYTIDRSFETEDFDAVAGRTRAALAAEGFGLLNEIDVKAGMKARLGADTGEHLILGACSPKVSVAAMQIEPHAGVMLPCNVILRRTGPGRIEVSAASPVASMSAVLNEKLEALAGAVREMLEKAIARI